MQAVHVDITQYSNVYDIKNRKVYLYHFHDYDHVVEIDLLNELEKGDHSYYISHSIDMPDLFPNNDEFDKYRKAYPKLPVITNILFKPFFIFCAILFFVSPFILLWSGFIRIYYAVIISILVVDMSLYSYLGFLNIVFTSN